jgi:hypothetical protein
MFIFLIVFLKTIFSFNVLMANIFTLENFDDFNDTINIDDLYEKKRLHDLNKLALFNKILNRVHVRIKTTSSQKMNDTFCWFVVPEVIIGVPKYDQGACIAYIMDKLQENKFLVKYLHPNTLFISWQHWVPSYVRTELKKKTGIVINEYGEKISEETKTDQTPQNSDVNMFSLKLNNSKTETKQEKNSRFTPIDTYKPTGNLVYNKDLLTKLNP